MQMNNFNELLFLNIVLAQRNPKRHAWSQFEALGMRSRTRAVQLL